MQLKTPMCIWWGDKGKRNRWKETDFKPLLSEVGSSPTPHLVSYLRILVWIWDSLMHRAKRESQFLSNNFPGGLDPKVSGRQCGLLVLFFILLLLFFAPPPSSLNTSSLKTIKPVSQMQYGGGGFFICWVENHMWGIKWLNDSELSKNTNAGHLTKNSELSW